MDQRLAIAGAVAVLGAIAALVHPNTAHSSAIETRAESVPSAPASEAPPREPSGSVVYVVGEVRRPGVYTLRSDARVDAALRAAGGPTANADLVAVNLAERIADGERVLVVAKGAHVVEATRRRAADSATEGEPAGRRTRGHRHAKHPPPGESIDLNTAGEAELSELPGIGPSLAARIVAYRDLNGRFSSLDDLLDVGGMTDRRLEQISPYAIVR